MSASGCVCVGERERRSLWLCFGCCVDIWWNKSDICVKVDDLCCSIFVVFCSISVCRSTISKRGECQKFILILKHSYGSLCVCLCLNVPLCVWVCLRMRRVARGQLLVKINTTIVHWMKERWQLRWNPRRLSHISVSVWRAFCSAGGLELI